MNEFIGWEILTIFAGCAAVTGLITQFTKKLFSKLPTQLLSYIIAVVVMGLATIFITGFSWSSIALIPINAIKWQTRKSKAKRLKNEEKLSTIDKNINSAFSS